LVRAGGDVVRNRAAEVDTHVETRVYYRGKAGT
jgi:hypothetical protein